MDANVQAETEGYQRTGSIISDEAARAIASEYGDSQYHYLRRFGEGHLPLDPRVVQMLRAEVATAPAMDDATRNSMRTWLDAQ